MVAHLLTDEAFVEFISHSSLQKIGTAATNAEVREFAAFTKLACLTAEAVVALAIRSILILRFGTYVE